MSDLKIDCISDTHGRHDKIKLPGGDILICAGDISGRGESKEILRFLEWFKDQDYSHLVMIAGNHDFGFEKSPELYKKCCEERGIVLLSESSYVADGIKIWGSPASPWFHNWAFNYERGDEISKIWEQIPEDTEILVTHGPPLHILDDANARGYSNHVGCYDLARRIREIPSIKLHVFGHIHEAAGYKYEEGKTYVNAASLDGMYCYNPPGYTHLIKDLAGQYFVEPHSENENT